MTTTLEVLFWSTVKLFLVALGILYVGMVLVSYRTEGLRYRLRLQRNDLARSAERLLVWLGLRGIGLLLHGAAAVLGMLSEASADVAEWFIRRGGGKLEATYRSRFL
jgi:hypothetical protein